MPLGILRDDTVDRISSRDRGDNWYLALSGCIDDWSDMLRLTLGSVMRWFMPRLTAVGVRVRIIGGRLAAGPTGEFGRRGRVRRISRFLVRIAI